MGAASPGQPSSSITPAFALHLLAGVSNNRWMAAAIRLVHRSVRIRNKEGGKSLCMKIVNRLLPMHYTSIADI